MARLVAFGYYGGKYYQLNWLKNLLPKCHHFVEPFCGSAIVTLNRDPSPLETINDLNGDLTNFFVQLRDNSDQLLKKLKLTAYSRDEYLLALQPTDDDLERARRFFVKTRQSFGGMTHKLTTRRWGRVKNSFKSSHTAIKFLNSVEKLPQIVDRLKCIQVENSPALKLIHDMDSEHVLFYCDPPYVNSTCDTRNFGDYVLSDNEHDNLSEVLHNCQAKVAISGQRCSLYDNLYRDWFRYDKTDNRVFMDNEVNPNWRIESLWTNYEVTNAN